MTRTATGICKSSSAANSPWPSETPEAAAAASSPRWGRRLSDWDRVYSDEAPRDRGHARG
eukprot:8871477-Prorocentrum_lima.AAC.1